ncbi:sugar ABC transporter permease [Candidatus Gracilibacteria bacterium]|nr:sugar ABC transporter permease [Candidatus Gracilibacteria bacterium]
MQRDLLLTAQARSGRRKRRQLREQLDALLMLLPTLLGALVFMAVPLAISFYLSFTDARLFGTPTFIGLENYRELLSDRLFHKALRNTFAFTLLALIFTTAPALFLAILLNERLPGRLVFRTLFFLPVVASAVGVALLWRYLLNYDYGLINALLTTVGLPRVGWLVSPQVALLSVVIVFSWQTIGYNMVIFLAGLQGVSRVLYEAASIDGANRWQLFVHVTLPGISPTSFFVVVTTLIQCLQIFDVPFAMGITRSSTVGPADSMLTIVTLLYREGFLLNQKGYASAIAWALFLAIILITYLQFRIAERWVQYDV